MRRKSQREIVIVRVRVLARELRYVSYEHDEFDNEAAAMLHGRYLNPSRTLRTVPALTLQQINSAGLLLHLQKKTNNTLSQIRK